MRKTIDDRIDVRKANRHLDSLSAEDRIRWARDNAPGKIVATTSGGETSRILPNLIIEALGETIPTIFVDTRYYPEETYDFIKRMRKKGVDVRNYKPDMPRELITALYGEDPRSLTGEEYEEFREIVKHEPLNKAFRELKPSFWLRGAMGFQTDERSEKDVLEYKNELYQFNPMIDWSEEQANKYIKNEGLPTNSDHFDVTKREPSDKITKKEDLNKECRIGERCGLVYE